MKKIFTIILSVYAAVAAQASFDMERAVVAEWQAAEQGFREGQELLDNQPYCELYSEDEWLLAQLIFSQGSDYEEGDDDILLSPHRAPGGNGNGNGNKPQPATAITYSQGRVHVPADFTFTIENPNWGELYIRRIELLDGTDTVCVWTENGIADAYTADWEPLSDGTFFLFTARLEKTFTTVRVYATEGMSLTYVYPEVADPDELEVYCLAWATDGDERYDNADENLLGELLLSEASYGEGLPAYVFMAEPGLWDSCRLVVMAGGEVLDATPSLPLGEGYSYWNGLYEQKDLTLLSFLLADMVEQTDGSWRPATAEEAAEAFRPKMALRFDEPDELEDDEPFVATLSVHLMPGMYRLRTVMQMEDYGFGSDASFSRTQTGPQRMERGRGEAVLTADAEGDYLISWTIAYDESLDEDAEGYSYFLLSVSFPEPTCSRGDVNMDGTIDVSDISTLAEYIFGNEPSQFCAEAADANEDGAIDVSDISTIAEIIFGN